MHLLENRNKTLHTQVTHTLTFTTTDQDLSPTCSCLVFLELRELVAEAPGFGAARRRELPWSTLSLQRPSGLHVVAAHSFDHAEPVQPEWFDPE